MEKTSVFEAKFDKLNNYCFFFEKNDETNNLIGKTVKFLKFELSNEQIFDNENKNINTEKSICDLSIILYSPRDVIGSSSKILAEISLNNGEKDSQTRQINNDFLNISKECYLKLEEGNSDKPEHLLSAENKYSLKITYVNNKHIPNSNLNNIQSVIKEASYSKNYFGQLKDDISDEDEEDEDYEESQTESIENSINSDEDEEDFNEDLTKNKSNTLNALSKENLDYDDDEEDGDAKFVQDLFEEAEDINRDLLYLTDDDLESENYLHLICDDEGHDDKYNTNNNNNISQIPGKKRYMLRRKRQPYNN